MILRFTIENSGSLPASDVNTDIDFFEENEEVTEDNLSNKYPPPIRQSEVAMVFPNKPYYEDFSLNLKDKDDKELWQNIENGKVKVRLRIAYRCLDREYKTINTERIVKLEGKGKPELLPSFPQKWK